MVTKKWVNGLKKLLKMSENKAQPITRGIANKGFSGMRRVVARFNFSCNLIGNHPQSLTGHTANVSCKFKSHRKLPNNKVLQVFVNN